VDDLGIKYVGREHAEHLMESIKKNNEISSDWTGSAYCVLKSDWNYNNEAVDLSVPGNIKAALHNYHHPAPARSEHEPRTWNPPIYGAKTQYIEEAEESPALKPKYVNRLQKLVGTLLYYKRAVEPTVIMSVNVLASLQTKETAETADKIIKLLNYCKTHLDVILRYHTSYMIFNIHSDTSYLSEMEDNIRSGGFFYMGRNTDTANRLANGEIMITKVVLKHIMSSATEA
jgi:hypothetical protein